MTNARTKTEGTFLSVFQEHRFEHFASRLFSACMIVKRIHPPRKIFTQDCRWLPLPSPCGRSAPRSHLKFTKPNLASFSCRCLDHKLITLAPCKRCMCQPPPHRYPHANDFRLTAPDTLLPTKNIPQKSTMQSVKSYDCDKPKTNLGHLSEFGVRIPMST